MNYVIRLSSFYKLLLRTPLKEILNDLTCKQVHYAYLFGGQHLALKRLRAMWALGAYLTLAAQGFGQVSWSHYHTPIVPWFHYSVKTVSVSQCQQ